MPQCSRTVLLTVSGLVQGVCYRAWTAENARALKLDGWVRNRADGSVEALFSGDAQSVAAMIERCRRGPPAARVTDVKIAEESGVASGGFTVRPTA
jgi:acylphosphatase